MVPVKSFNWDHISLAVDRSRPGVLFDSYLQVLQLGCVDEASRADDRRSGSNWTPLNHDEAIPSALHGLGRHISVVDIETDIVYTCYSIYDRNVCTGRALHTYP